MGSLRPDTSHPPSRTVSPISPSSALPTNDDIEAIIQLATSSSPLPQKDTRTQLFVGNLPYRVRWQDLKDLFRKAGTVLRADVSLGPDNRSRGYGTVLLASAEDAGRAIDMFNGYNWQTRVLEVRLDRLPVDLDSLGLPAGTGTPNAALSPFIAPAMDEYSILDRPSSSGGTRSLFVGNLPFHCQWQDLKDLFRQAGTILRADVALGPDGRSRGFGTVSFATESDAERAVGMFNGCGHLWRLRLSLG
ncbi:RNA-binding domain-containing protein [Neolentinus lepideus HHB14362 ss-1]|uniref:RNA-binding domain-containing protein n=1 Tax=Neolentinus lepideus HHB14362 ss-1 TaxID=1314782 RepID=A0A165ST57_9AGAM|nr:RNA-binding domain-containing protein [Neolentinus lepideus HHB14362 ss-1]